MREFAGRVAVVTGSAKGIEDGVTGRVVPDGNAEAFAGAIVGLLRDDATRGRLGHAAMQAVQDPLAWEQVLDRIESIYRTVVAGDDPSLVPTYRRENVT